jgi:hypothetical protein
LVLKEGEMCLIHEEPITVAEKDIYCYKVLELVPIIRNKKTAYKMRRLYRNLTPVKGGLSTESLFPEMDTGFYAFLSKRTALMERDYRRKLGKTMDSKYICLKCKIPKGTRIIKGHQYVLGKYRYARGIRAEAMIHGVA